MILVEDGEMIFSSTEILRLLPLGVNLSTTIIVSILFSILISRLVVSQHTNHKAMQVSVNEYLRCPDQHIGHYDIAIK